MPIRPAAPRELEAKVEVRSTREARSILTALGVPEGVRGTLAAVEDAYFDSEDLALLRAGFGYRIRRRPGGGFEATIKSLGRVGRAGILDREERTAEIPHASPDPRLLPDGEPRRTLEIVLDGRDLHLLARVRGRRTTWRVAPEPGLSVEVARDRVTLSCRGERVRGDEIEAERLEGSTPAFSAWVARALRGLRAKPSRGSKLERALRAAGVRIPPAVEIATARLALQGRPGPRTPAAAAASREMARLAEALRRAMGSARRGGIEGVHALRTTTRRVRAILSAYSPEVPAAVGDDLKARLRALRRAAGPARDLDVLAAMLRGGAGKDADPAGVAALLEVVAARRVAARKALADALRTPRTASLPERLGYLASALVKRSSPPLAIAGACRLPAALEEALARRAAIVGDLRAAAAPVLHVLRVALKRARYAAEAFAPAFGRPVTEFVRAATKVQETLGAVQDAALQREAMRSLLGSIPSKDRRFEASRLAAAAVGDALEAAARRARKRGARAVDEALSETTMKALGAHLGKRAAGSAARGALPARA